LTIEPRDFVPIPDVLTQVRQALSDGTSPDVITVAGSGEPTLHARLADLATGLRELTDSTLLLITNGSLLWREDVARAAALFDLVAPSLDAGDESTFARINRANASLSFAQVLEGLLDFTSDHPDKVRLEVFVAKGLNDSPESLEAIIKAVDRISPRRVDLNTAVRPTPGRTVTPVSPEFLVELAARLSCPAEPIIPYAGPAGSTGSGEGLEERIVTSLRRRPSTLQDLATALNAPSQLVAKAIGTLLQSEQISEKRRVDGTWYVAGV